MTENTKNLGDELIASMGEALAHARGEDNGTRVSEIEMPAPRVRAIRAKVGLSQERFAPLLGVSVSGLRKWEQGTRQPKGAAATLLRIMEAEPQAVARALASMAPSDEPEPAKTRQPAGEWPAQ